MFNNIKEPIIEWELVSQCNYKCFYCELPDFKFVTNVFTLYKFIKKIPHINNPIFLFGGEPFLHPKIEFIIQTFIKLNNNFVIQTNLSNKSVKNIDKISKDLNYTIQISIHPTETTLTDAIENIKTVDKISNIKIGKIDIMYSTKEALKYAVKIQNMFPLLNVEMLPICGFYEDKSTEFLKEYNIIRPKYEKVINFETFKIGDTYRSDLWQKNTSFKGLPCTYNYMLYSSDLKLYNCCHRDTNIDNICKYDKCFLM